MAKILGIDPSLNCLGWFLFDSNKFKVIDYGYIENKDLAENEKLLKIYNMLKTVIDTYKIDVVGIEQEFYGRNVKTLQKLSRVHGCILLLLAQKNIPYTYYSVATLKSKTLQGMKTKDSKGKKKTAKQVKQEVANKIFDIFGRHNFIKDITDDVTDAASAAITYYLMDGKSTDEFDKNKTTNNAILLNNYKRINKLAKKDIYEI